MPSSFTDFKEYPKSLYLSHSQLIPSSFVSHSETTNNSAPRLINKVDALAYFSAATVKKKVL
jgi:hypothetical protein